MANAALARIGALQVRCSACSPPKSSPPGSRMSSQTDLFGELRLEPGRLVQYKPLLDEAINCPASSPRPVLCCNGRSRAAISPAGRDHDWAELRANALSQRKNPADCVPVKGDRSALHSLHFRHHGQTKGVVRDNGGHLVALKWSMFNLYGVEPGEVWWCGSDIGWVVGHTYIIYGPLSMARPRSCMRASRSARRMPARSGA